MVNFNGLCEPAREAVRRGCPWVWGRQWSSLTPQLRSTSPRRPSASTERLSSGFLTLHASLPTSGAGRTGIFRGSEPLLRTPCPMTSTANHLTLPILIRTMRGVWRSSYKLSNSEASRVASIDPLGTFPWNATSDAGDRSRHSAQRVTAAGYYSISFLQYIYLPAALGCQYGEEMRLEICTSTAGPSSPLDRYWTESDGLMTDGALLLPRRRSM